MILLINETKIHSIYNADAFNDGLWRLDTNGDYILLRRNGEDNAPFPLKRLDIDRVFPDNKELRLDIRRVQNKVDINGYSKYHLDADGDLADRDGWEEHIENPHG